MHNNEKHAEYMRKWRDAHPENRDYQREYQKKYYKKHRKIMRARTAKWYEDNHERALATRAKYQRDHYKPKGRPSGPAHHAWKGDHASYYAIHIWITNHKGRPSLCELCGSTTAKKYEWANIDHKYRRVLEDYFRVCTPCHRDYDYKNGLAQKGGPRKRIA